MVNAISGKPHTCIEVFDVVRFQLIVTQIQFIEIGRYGRSRICRGISAGNAVNVVCLQNIGLPDRTIRALAPVYIRAKACMSFELPAVIKRKAAKIVCAFEHIQHVADIRAIKTGQIYTSQCAAVLEHSGRVLHVGSITVIQERNRFQSRQVCKHAIGLFRQIDSIRFTVNVNRSVVIPCKDFFRRAVYADSVPHRMLFIGIGPYDGTNFCIHSIHIICIG